MDVAVPVKLLNKHSQLISPAGRRLPAPDLSAQDLRLTSPSVTISSLTLGSTVDG